MSIVHHNRTPSTKKISVSKALTLQYTDKPHYHAVNSRHTWHGWPAMHKPQSDPTKPMHSTQNNIDTRTSVLNLSCDTTNQKCDTTNQNCDTTNQKCDTTNQNCDTTNQKCDTTNPNCDTYQNGET